MVRGQAITKEEMVGILRKEMVPLLLDFHEKVQVPMMDEVLTRLGGVEKRIDEVELSLKNEIGRLERKLDRVTDHQAVVLDDHSVRIGRIEAII